MNTQSEPLWNVRRILRAFLPLVLLVGGTILADIARAESPNDILIIANPGVTVSSLGADEAKEIFLKKKTSWGAGMDILPINVADDPKLREDFRATVLKMAAAEEQRYWQSRKIKDGVYETVAFPNVQKAVGKLRGAVSYVYRSQYKGGEAKVLLAISTGK